MRTNQETGRDGEDKAAALIKERGFNIISRNYRYKKSGEIDIIAKKDQLITFIEVKNRKSSHYGGALYSLTPKKLKTLRFIAEQFLAENPHLHTKELSYRFDLIAIDEGEISWIEDIIR